jgi:hypothetical protein
VHTCTHMSLFCWQSRLFHPSPPPPNAHFTALEKYLQFAHGDSGGRAQQGAYAAGKSSQHAQQGVLHAQLDPGLAWLAPLIFVLLQNPLNSDPASFGALLLLRMGRLLSVTLPPAQRIPVRAALQQLLGRLPPDVLAARCVRPVQRYLEHLVARGKLGAARLEVGEKREEKGREKK